MENDPEQRQSHTDRICDAGPWLSNRHASPGMLRRRLSTAAAAFTSRYFGQNEAVAERGPKWKMGEKQELYVVNNSKKGRKYLRFVYFNSLDRTLTIFHLSSAVAAKKNIQLENNSISIDLQIEIL